jgi:hypothetical protein
MIYIHVRRTLDWADEAAVEAGLIAKFRPKLEMWNATFTIPYHRFRQRLKEIAEASLSRVENARVAPLEAVPPEAIVLPVDDDDWFSPEIGTRLEEADEPSIAGYHWVRHILEPDRHRRRFKGLLKEALTRKVIFATNNYALRNRPELGRLLQDHIGASGYFHEHPRAFRYLPRAMSMHNRSLASQTVLAIGRPAVTREELLEAYALHRTLYARTRLSRALRWAQPYVDAMAELMEALEVR